MRLAFEGCCFLPVGFDKLRHVPDQAFEREVCQMIKLNEYVKVAEAASVLGVSQGTIRSWAAAGKIPMHRNPANGYRLFRRSDLAKFLAMVAKPQKPK
jgi:excisionase family DNA binding protein